MKKKFKTSTMFLSTFILLLVAGCGKQINEIGEQVGAITIAIAIVIVAFIRGIMNK